MFVITYIDTYDCLMTVNRNSLKKTDNTVIIIILIKSCNVIAQNTEQGNASRLYGVTRDEFNAHSSYNNK